MDKLLILRKLTELDTYMQQIGEYQAISVGEYRGDWKIQRIIERTLQMMIELCVDIANHIISEKALPVPTSYADTFEILKRYFLISDSLAEIMVRMAKFRNILVHQYTQVDALIVVSILQAHLNDFTLFRNEIVDLLQEK
ncbi:MAG: DUF86 domain-containing protein [Candidatus Contendobacter sp.]|nr:DUF86 domain-containing protein [Candidatus Contendobacter sp.]